MEHDKRVPWPSAIISLKIVRSWHPFSSMAMAFDAVVNVHVQPTCEEAKLETV